MVLTWSYDPTTDRGRVRLNIQDNRGVDTVAGSDFLFADEEIDAFLISNNGNVRLGTAQALVTMATNQILLLKVLKMGLLGTDGKAVADTLMALAADYRQQDLNAIDPTSPTGPWDYAHFPDCAPWGGW